MIILRHLAAELTCLIRLLPGLGMRYVGNWEKQSVVGGLKFAKRSWNKFGQCEPPSSTCPLLKQSRIKPLSASRLYMEFAQCYVTGLESINSAERPHGILYSEANTNEWRYS